MFALKQIVFCTFALDTLQSVHNNDKRKKRSL